MKALVLLLLVSLLDISQTDGHQPSNHSVLPLGLPHYNNNPCRLNNNGLAMFRSFKRKHILWEDININDREAWTDYLKDRDLLERANNSFLMKDDASDAKNICNGQSIPFKRNLCISRNKFKVCDVRSSNRLVIGVKCHTRYVIVACDAVDMRKTRGNSVTKCLPVHYQSSRKRRNVTRGSCQYRQ